MRLSRLNEQVKENQDITPAILPLFSYIESNTTISQTQLDILIKNENRRLAFNIKDWNTFIKDLNFCLEKKLSARDKRAIKCIKYWKKNILEANQVTDDMIRFAEEFYQKNPANTFGITEGSYKYLVELIDKYDKI